MIPRYSRKEMAQIWEPMNKFKIWLDIEIYAAQAMEKLNIASKSPVVFRGKTGKGLNVMSNYLRLDSKPDIGTYEYEVRFDPIIDMRNEKFRILQQLEPIIGPTKVGRIEWLKNMFIQNQSRSLKFLISKFPFSDF